MANRGDVVHKYYSRGPVSLNQIDTNLYLGNLAAATDVITLNVYKITHIVTIDTSPLPQHILDLKHIAKKYIRLLDQATEDLLSHFDDTYDFITEGMKNGNVYVHCYFGVSRSASVVIAFLMKKYNLTYREAFERTKKKRSEVYPNPGFVSQLKLYYEMKYTVNKDHMKYKMHRLRMAANKIKRSKPFPQEWLDLIKKEPSQEGNGFKCKKCHLLLAGEPNLITHWDQTSENSICSKKYFVEPLAWMEEVAQVIEGKLHCPKCSSNVGSFNWHAGCKCPCGRQVTPAFYICPLSIDRFDVA